MTATPLRPPSREELGAFARRGDVLVASDFDGVLAPIVLDPASARPQPGTIEALSAMAALPGVSVALASGRDLATLRALTGIDESSPIVLIGSHGAEISTTLGSAAPGGSALSDVERAALDGATHALETIAERLPATRVEYKPAGVVLHTRGMDEDEAERATCAALAVPQDVPGVHAMRGKAVVELSVLDVSKGAALAALAAERNLRATFYLGDDVTDETVFTTLRAGSDIGVKVGDGDTAAAHRVPGCTDVPPLLDALLGALTKARRDAPRDDADVRDDADAGKGAVSAPEAGR